ncbi:MAG: hypothetical protein M1839_009392 [Geoglossum umbratile]|nr:MAG: hypothetical protein M1839_009392 [Geoglossum umbratile]
MYGDVVRIGPNELTFATAQSFNDIYGHSTKDRLTFVKGTFYEHPQPEPGVVAERRPERHRETRRQLSHGFSAKALKDQEDVLREYCDLFISQIRKQSAARNGLNMKEWFSWLSFDIIGELAFGESFGAVRSGKAHFWVETIHDAAFLVTLFEVSRRLPLFWPFILLAIPRGFKQKFDLFLKYSKEQVRKRVARQGAITRTDFFNNLLSEKATNVSEDWLIAQANVLVIAGSDTTATALATITYFLTKHPQQVGRLQDEIRGAFSDSDQMADSTLQSLPYLTAVIEEGLRMFPPTAFGLPRISPGATVDGHFVPPGVTVSTSSWTTTRREQYWRSPRTFIPERWLPPTHPLHDDRFKDDNNGAAKPFSLGPRGCLGINLAYMEMRLTLARLVWTFDMRANAGTKTIDWEDDARFEGFWNIPSPMIHFDPRSDNKQQHSAT